MLYFFDRDKLRFKRLPIKYVAVPFVVIILAIAIRPDNIVTRLHRVHTHSVHEVQPKKLRFTINRFKDMLIKLNVKHPDIVFAQAKLETGNFRSSVFRTNNNLFGFKVARSRPTVCIGMISNHAAYDNWQMSVIDYAIWQSKYCSRMSHAEYLSYLKENYAEDDNYVDKLGF